MRTRNLSEAFGRGERQGRRGEGQEQERRKEEEGGGRKQLFGRDCLEEEKEKEGRALIELRKL